MNGDDKHDTCVPLKDYVERVFQEHRDQQVDSHSRIRRMEDAGFISRSELYLVVGAAMMFVSLIATVIVLLVKKG